MRSEEWRQFSTGYRAIKVGQIVSHCTGRNISVLDRSKIVLISLLNFYSSLRAVGEQSFRTPSVSGCYYTLET